jgi:hypothetical protein
VCAEDWSGGIRAQKRMWCHHPSIAQLSPPNLYRGTLAGMRAETITITLAIDVPEGGSVPAAEKTLIAVMDEAVGHIGTGQVVREPAPLYSGLDGGYRQMRDGENRPQYTEVRAQAEVLA